MASHPLLSLTLLQGNTWGHDMMQLNRPTMQGLNLFKVTTFDTERTLTLACTALDAKTRRVDLVAALCAGLFQLVDEDTQQLVAFPPETAPVGSIAILPKEKPGDYQLRVGLGIDTTAQIWKDLLEPSKTYAVRFSPSGGEAWCSHDDEENRLPVRREPDVLRFTVYNDPAPPTLSAVFGVEPAVCHRSGSPPFKFVVDISLPDDSDGTSSRSDTPLTIKIAGTWFDVSQLNCIDQLVHCVDADTGEKPDFDARFHCGLDASPPGFPADDMFVELWPGGQPWRFEYTLRDSSTPGPPGGLDDLVVGHQYSVKLSDQAVGFGWRWGKKEELLKGTEQEKAKRWAPGPRGNGIARIKQVNGPVTFDVVD
ncbi:uncharacterized protein BKCO1_4000089 [Diplodia corticola]|uniref:Uncharacterized protein n=1 Tax=Diplodia corticola TaxID=236234 RepID=A0A1J9QUW1_9PEZI|nr:uncharacterized protein BKCO1_4000089 [Diplodia corticola]OJD32185.1 hypothetical protein BKCO1_4000089 [Diplodia corticola]